MGFSLCHRHPAPPALHAPGRARALLAALGLVALLGPAASAGAAAEADAEQARPAAERARPFCTTSCRPREGSLSSGVGFAAGVAAAALVARRRGPAA